MAIPLALAVLPLYGDLPLERQQEVLRPSERRRVVLATNVAETSVTIEGVTAIVDSGLARLLRLDPALGLNRLETKRISRASADQRAGRAGRTAPGVCLRLWTEREQRALDEQELPEIARVDLAGPVLERWRAPGGSWIALRYEPGQPPILAARIQQLFGLRQTPRVAGGRVGVLLHLLAPNMRPQQVTGDLESFWKNTYPQVRKELRRRYPKHAWPEDPWSATPQR